jgi:hypothetical protein
LLSTIGLAPVLRRASVLFRTDAMASVPFVCISFSY